MSLRRAPGALEADVQAVLWSAPAPLTPSDVLERLGGDLAYTTVLTILTRLYDKGVVTRERTGRAYAYSPSQAAADAAALRMHAVLDAGIDRSSVLARFVDALTPEDEGLLRRLLVETDSE